MDVQALPVLDDALVVGHHVRADIQPPRGLGRAGGDDLVAPLDLILLDAVQGQGQPLTRGPPGAFCPWTWTSRTRTGVFPG